MEHKKNPCYLGIDLNDKTAMVSYYYQGMKEPETVSTVAGDEVYSIPVVLAKRKGIGQWYYGDEARKMAKNGDMICIDSLLRRAVNGEKIVIEEETYKAEDLLALYITKLMAIPHKFSNIDSCDKLIVAVETLTKDCMEMFWRIVPKIGLKTEQFIAIDYKESFCYFALSQVSELWAHDVFLFECDKNNMRYYSLKRNAKTMPQVITIERSPKSSIRDNKDEMFLNTMQKVFENRMISTVYLVGEGFEGDWMESSLSYLCKGRRAFMGNNLFTKGACYAALAKEDGDKWPFIYMGENEVKFNLSLKVKSRGELCFYYLISAGKYWFNTSGSCEVILSDTAEIDFWKQLPNSREAKIETLELTDFPVRPDRTTRVRITAKPISDDKIEIEIKDLGFGEFFRSSDRVWHCTMSM